MASDVCRRRLDRRGYPSVERGRTEEDAPHRWVEFYDHRLYPVTNRILRLRARTLAGLAIQAKAYTLAIPEVWDHRNNGNDERDTFEFVETVCAFAGVQPVWVMREQRLGASAL
jgi:hypothetical protein